MPLTAEWIDAKIQRLARLKEIISDPEMVKLLREALADEDAVANSAEAGVIFTSASKPRAHIPTTEPSAKPRRGALKQAVTAAVLQVDNWISAYDLADQMIQQGYEFASAKPALSVNDVLRQLAEDGVLEVEEGSGSIPNRYRPLQRHQHGEAQVATAPQEELENFF